MGCGEFGQWLCCDCFDSIHATRHAFASKIVDGIVTCGSYANPVLRRIITSVKYQAASCLQDAVRAILEKRRSEARDPWPWTDDGVPLIVAVPSEDRRVRERGIRHAAWLADLVKEALVPWAMRDDLLRRQGRSISNATLPPDALRRANTYGKFHASKPVQGSVILVDDVLTTGATAEEAARVLKSAGASSVYLFALAHGK